MELFNFFLEKYFKKKASIYIVILLGILVSILLCHNISSLCLKSFICLCIWGILVFYIIEVILYNKLPKNRKGDAVLVRIFAKNIDEFEDIKYKFGDQFEEFIKTNESNINIIYIPYHLIDKNKYKEKDKIIKLLKKTNCIFLITVRVRSEEIKDNTKYVTEFNMGIIHPAYVKKVEEIFQNEINVLGMKISRLEFFKENKINTLEVTAQRISIVCRYIIARAYYLSGQVSRALCIAEDLYKELNKDSERLEKIYKNLLLIIRELCFNIHIINASVEYSKNNKNIEYIEKELDEANKYIKNTYIYYENKSACAFLKNRDINKAQYYIGCCKKIRYNDTWKYSSAFLKAYCNESEGAVVYQYKQAFKIPYEHMQLISFIEDILAQEPEKNKLRLALILLYLKIDEIETAKSILKDYLKNEKSNGLRKDTINQMKKIYNESVINDLLDL